MTSKNILFVLSLFVLVLLISARDILESSSNSKADVMNGGTNNGLNEKSESDCTGQGGGLGGCKWSGGWGWGWGTPPGPGGEGWGWGWGGPLPAPGGVPPLNRHI
ncbi:hypothetical protein HN51_049805 [Arachis hypogaea]|uniref:glycine-rich protein DOT1-like n=1 Tax=Arachis ipaensis TaxID=130454 RepID=UPI000A2B2496|nr:glycine-rich protein DOT1-like [Arachis ipaensis]XP_025668995.1 glycine-rich protein DOT1-like [Arachis hypogaea]QHN91428.1 uncharacterized protein DS421_17g574760 [Arachis hypogaea]